MTIILKLLCSLKTSDFSHTKQLIESCSRLYTQQSKFQRTLLLTIPHRHYAKEVYKREKPHCNIGTIGHLGHGKTTLTAAITKVLAQKKLSTIKKYEEIDNAPQEREKGISINFSSLDYATENRYYSHTDCPGHVDYINNMITGTSQMEGAIMVVAGTEGVMPQTREHLLLAKHLGLQRLVIYINKADAADKELLKLVEMDIRELLSKMGYNGDETPVIQGSALAALEGKNDEIGLKSIETLLEAVDTYIPIPKRDLALPFMLPIERIFHIQGKGIVVSGRLARGIIKNGYDAEIIGFGMKLNTVISEMEMFYKTMEEVQAGDFCQILVKGLKRDDVKKGMVLCKPNTLNIHDNFESNVYLITEEEGGASDEPTYPFKTVQVFSKSWVVAGKVLLPGNEMVTPGNEEILNFRLHKPMMMEKGQRFTVRSNGKAFGSGVISDIKANLTDEERGDLTLSKKKREKKFGIKSSDN